MPIDETTPTRPINPYGESKLAFEKILRWYDQIHGLKFVSLRYFNAAGASEKFGEDHRVETHLIPNVLKVALGEKPHVEIFGTDYETPDGTCIRDYIHIIDLAQAHILALGASKSEFYNLGTGGGSSVREVIDACRKVTGRKIDIVEKPRRPGDPPRLIASSEKIKTRTWLEAAVSIARRHHRERVEMAPEISARLRRLRAVATKKRPRISSRALQMLNTLNASFTAFQSLSSWSWFLFRQRGLLSTTLRTIIRSPSRT